MTSAAGGYCGEHYAACTTERETYFGWRRILCITTNRHWVTIYAG